MEITEDTGSIFDTYYVSGFVAAGGILGHSKGAIVAYSDYYDFTIRDYEDGLSLIESMLEMDVPERNKGLFLQQQFVSVFSLMEQFLSCTFVRQTCDCEDSYRRVLASGELLKHSSTKDNRVLKGPDGLEKELKFIEVANNVIYNNQQRVAPLFREAFDVDVDLSPLKVQVEIRNDIAHRFGHKKNRSQVSVTEKNVRDLMVSIDGIVRKTIEQISKLPPSEGLYEE